MELIKPAGGWVGGVGRCRVEGGGLRGRREGGWVGGIPLCGTPRPHHTPTHAPTRAPTHPHVRARSRLAQERDWRRNYVGCRGQVKRGVRARYSSVKRGDLH